MSPGMGQPLESGKGKGINMVIQMAGSPGEGGY